MKKKRNMFDEVARNKIESVMMMGIFIIIIAALGSLIGFIWGGFDVNSLYWGVFLATIASLIYILISYYSGDSMVLATTGAKPVSKKEYPHLFHTVEGLAIAAGIPAPKAYVIKDSALNAFATGRDPKHASITVTTGLLEKLNRQELEGVIAHEMSHIKNFDIRVMMLTAVLVGIITLLSDILLRSFLFGGSRNSNREGGQIQIIMIVVGLLLAILTPIIAQLIKLAISRKREFAADANGAILSRYPPGLAGALKKIRGDPDPLVDHANRATAHLFISTPFRKKKGWMTGLFSTHPPIDERIKRLEAM